MCRLHILTQMHKKVTPVRDTYTVSDEFRVENRVSEVEDSLGVFAGLRPVLPAGKIVFWISWSTETGTGLLAGC